MLSLSADSPLAQSHAAPWPRQAEVLQWPWSPFQAPKLQTVSMTQAGHVSQADGNAMAFLGCSSGCFQAGTNCVGGGEVSEKRSGGKLASLQEEFLSKQGSQVKHFKIVFLPQFPCIPLSGALSWAAMGPLRAKTSSTTATRSQLPYLCIQHTRACRSHAKGCGGHLPLGCFEVLGIPKEGRIWGQITG